MSSFSYQAWGNAVGEVGRACSKTGGLATSSRCSILRPVDISGGFTPSFSHVFRMFFHTLQSIFTFVIYLFLPTINTPNKDNNKLNKLILLTGGLV
jgi:hypothetical protein